MNSTTRNGKAKNILYILAGLGGISLIILIHEMGHFLFAKLFGIPTPVFSLGFGPALLAFPIGKTVFTIALLPFGGYVEMDEKALAHLAYVPKMLIIFAGILFNFIFAYAILLYYALRDQFVLTPTISSITPHSPAAQANLHPGDIIIACNQQPIGENAELITKIIGAHAQQTIPLTIERNGTTQEVEVTLNAEHPLFGPHVGLLGVELEKKPIAQPSFKTTMQKGHTQFSDATQEMSKALSKIITRKDQKNVVMGPIGIISMIGKSLAINPQLYWFILAVLSLNLAFFNILPLPFFDGGKALIVTIEALTGKTIPATILWVVSTLFLALFMLFMARVTMADIKRLIGKK